MKNSMLLLCSLVCFTLLNAQESDQENDPINITNRIGDYDDTEFDHSSSTQSPYIIGDIFKDSITVLSNSGQSWVLSECDSKTIGKELFKFCKYKNDDGSCIIIFKKKSGIFICFAGFVFIFGGHGSDIEISEYKEEESKIFLDVECTGYFGGNSSDEGETSDSTSKTLVIDLK